jgi:BirA family biotin operon repressor/biotin-[acetyl-CoA-carboxylase] ligase
MIEWHDQVGSTMDLAHARAEQGAPHGTAIVARSQTAGRGRRGRSWVSPEGGLWMSVICRPGDASAVENLSLRVGLALADAIERLCPGLPRLTVKWPNDILSGGQKLAGILCEARWEGGTPLWVIAAVGLNVNNPIPADLATRATRLADLVPGVEPERLAGPLAEVIALATLQPGPLSRDEQAQLALRTPE